MARPNYGPRINIQPGRLAYKNMPRVRIWAGWYQHVHVYLDGTHIGTIQTKRQYKRESTITFPARGGGCVLGSAVDWLIRMAQSDPLPE